MGYSTDFEGEFKLDRPLKPEHTAYLLRFARTRRMKRKADETILLPDPVRAAADLPVGVDGEYFVGDEEDFGQLHTPDIVDYDNPPATQPGLWCQWIPTDEGTEIVWDGNEKFYHYTEWLRYIITHFLARWGYTLNGEVLWYGEDRTDMGTIEVVDNVVTARRASVRF